MINQVILSQKLIFELSEAELRLVSRLAVFGNRPFRLKMRDMARMTTMSVSTAQQAIKRLEERGYMEHNMCCIEGKVCASIYRLMLPKISSRFLRLEINEIKRVPYGCLRVYAYLVSRSGRTGKAYPSERSIADALKISYSTVRSCTAELEKTGLITKEKRYYTKKRPTRALRSFSYVLMTRVSKTEAEFWRRAREQRSSTAVNSPRRISRHTAKNRLFRAIRQIKAIIGILKRPIHKKTRVYKPPRSPNAPP